jgi:hypothetical protein
VSDYGLDDRAIEVRSLAEAKGFILYHLCPDRLWGPPSLLYNGYRGVLSPGVKARPRRDADHSPHLVPRSRISRSYTSSPPSAFMVCSGTALAVFVLRSKHALEETGAGRGHACENELCQKHQLWATSIKCYNRMDVHSEL